MQSFKKFIENFDRIYINHPFYGKETVGEFLQRHKVIINQNGTFTAYHGRPKNSNYNELKIGTYITFNPDDAKFFAARDRGLNPEKDIEVLKLVLTSDDIDPGIHPTLRTPYKLN